MQIIDSHFHWWPQAVFEELCSRPRMRPADDSAEGRVGYYLKPGGKSGMGSEWHDLEGQLAHMDGLGHEVSVISSIGPVSVIFSEFAAEDGRILANMWNDEMARAQREYPGRFWGSAALPLVDVNVAMDVLDRAIGDLGLVGVNIPGSVGTDPHIDAKRLEPLYARIEELGVPIFLHPTDAIFAEMLAGYGGALHLSLGRVIEVSVAAMRLVFSGIMERFPDLKIYMSHTGGALPYQSGRMDKNGKGAGLPLPPSAYLKRMYADVVSPHTLGMKFAIDYYGIDHIIYGSDFPCWSPADALRLFNEVGLSAADQKKILFDNARRIFNLEKTGIAATQPVRQRKTG